MIEKIKENQGVILGLLLAGVATWGLYELYFKTEGPKKGLNGNRDLKIGVKKTPWGYLVKGGGLHSNVVVKTKREADLIVRGYRKMLKQ